MIHFLYVHLILYDLPNYSLMHIDNPFKTAVFFHNLGKPLNLQFYLQAACCHLLLQQTQYPLSVYQTILVFVFLNPLKKKFRLKITMKRIQEVKVFVRMECHTLCIERQFFT